MADRRQLVLIADDDQAVRDALQFALRLEGLCVHVHSGGAALLADPDLSRAGCVVLGDRMRLMDGFTVMGTLKDRDIGVPAIMLTSHATARVRARADAAGVRQVLEKPLLDNALMEGILAILGVHS
jgi:two-component system, LuxR family, response regulator FixJ